MIFDPSQSGRTHKREVWIATGPLLPRRTTLVSLCQWVCPPPWLCHHLESARSKSDTLTEINQWGRQGLAYERHSNQVQLSIYPFVVTPIFTISYSCAFWLPDPKVTVYILWWLNGVNSSASLTLSDIRALVFGVSQLSITLSGQDCICTSSLSWEGQPPCPLREW